MRYHHGNLKQQLICNAYDWISANGAESISLRKIAAVAQVSQTAPYRHFDSKEHLLADVAAMGFENFSSAIGNNKVTDDPADDLVKCGLSYIEFGLKNKHIIDLMFNYPIKKTDFPDLLVAADKAFTMLLRRSHYLSQGSEDSVRLNSISMHAYVHGLLTILQMNRRIDNSATSAFYKASSAVEVNLEKMLTSFIKTLERS